MGPGRLEIEQIVQKINRGGAQAERDESEHCRSQGPWIRVAVRGEQRHDDEHVLGPLMRPQRADDRLERARRPWKRAYHSGGACDFGLEARAAVDDHGTGSSSPDLQVPALVAAVIETTL